MISSCDNQVIQPKEEAPTETTFIPFGQNKGKTTTLSEAPSPFGCTLSTLNPKSADKNYRYQSFYIQFSETVMQQANGKTAQQGFILNSKRVANRTPAFLNTKGTVRFMSCIIPDAPHARTILQKEMQKFGDQSWLNDFSAAQNAKHNDTTSGEFIEVCKLMPGNGEGVISNTLYPGTDEEFTIYFFHYKCHTEYVVNPEVDDPFGGGGGDNGDGDPPNPCNPNPGMDGVGDGIPLGCGGRVPMPGDGIPPPKPLDDDFVTSVDTTSLVCDGSYTGSASEKETKKAWCASSPPIGEQLQITNNALDNIEQRGSECAGIVQKGRQLLDEYGLRYYPDGTIGKGAKGGPSYGTVLSDIWLKDYVTNVGEVHDSDGTTVRINLEYALAHEIEHTMGRHHINGSAWRTPNAVQCSGL